MDSGMWAAIIGSAILVFGGGIGWLFTGHMKGTKDDAAAAQIRADQAHDKSHELEVLVLEQRAVHAEEMRKGQIALLQYQLLVANEYVKKSDHDAVVTDILRKMEGQNRQMSEGFTALRQHIDTKFEQVAIQLNAKQDRH